MALNANEFIRRFLLHVLPEGFRRIRYYGFLGHCCREKKLAAAASTARSTQTRHPSSTRGIACPRRGPRRGDKLTAIAGGSLGRDVNVIGVTPIWSRDRRCISPGRKGQTTRIGNGRVATASGSWHSIACRNFDIDKTGD
jgi:hypothetical protein